MPAQLVCYWCNQPKKNVQLITESKTHGICPACLKEHFALTVPAMYEALVAREEEIKLAKAKKRRERRAAKSWRERRAS